MQVNVDIINVMDLEITVHVLIKFEKLSFMEVSLCLVY